MGLAKYPWVAGKLIALACIFVGGGVWATTVIPLALLFPGDRKERTQAIIKRTFMFYLRLFQFLRLFIVSVEGAEGLVACGGKIVIANHPCLLDVVILMALIPRAQCIVKHELWNHRFLGVLMRSAGYIRNDLDPEALVAKCKTALDEGRSLIIFPEGTRTVPGRTIHFHRGFANIATLTRAPVQTIVITCSPIMLYKGEPWWRAPVKRPVLRVAVGECINEDFYLRYNRRSIAARRLVEYLGDYYRKMTANG